MASDWNPTQYHRFADERAQPFWDLVGLIEPGDEQHPIRRAVDLGCGSGELTAAAAERLRVGSMLGIDSSPAMLERAGAHVSDRVCFALGDIGPWTAGGDHDLVLANASLHWVADHAATLRRWTAAVRPGGQLAVQVPSNADQPAHAVADEVGRRTRFASAMEGGVPPDPVRDNVLAPEQYASLLHQLGYARQHVRLQVYPHLLASSADVVEWVRGTTLTRFFSRLPAELHEPFVDEYREELLARIGRAAPYLFPFKRVLMWGRLPG